MTTVDADETVAAIRRLVVAIRVMRKKIEESGNHPPSEEFEVNPYKKIKNTKPIRNSRLKAICKRAAGALGIWAEGTGEEAALTFPMQELARDIAALDDDIAAGRAKAK